MNQAAIHRDAPERTQILVIADDISGAAELAGAALRHGLSAEVQLRFDPGANSDVVCLDADTRSLPAPDAAQVFGELSRQIAPSHPAWIYKKCDSVLRGSVAAETRAMLAALRLPRACIVSANPSRERIIRDGLYYIHGQPLHETVFARDPEYPRTTSVVQALLGANLDSFIVPDVRHADDIEAQAATIDEATLPVGGVDFFEALLRRRGPRGAHEIEPLPPRREPKLLVCGSSASWSARRDEARAQGIPEFEMPHEPDRIITALSASRYALVGIGDNVFSRGGVPTHLAQQLARTVAEVIRQISPAQVLLEGGATAVAVIRALGWTRLRACEVSPAGVGLLAPIEAGHLRVVIKPGSYPWPERYWPPAK